MSAVAALVGADGAAAINVSFESVLDVVATSRRCTGIAAGPRLAPVVRAIRVGYAFLPVPARWATATAAVEARFRSVLLIVLAGWRLADVTGADTAVTVRTHGASFAWRARFATCV